MKRLGLLASLVLLAYPMFALAQTSPGATDESADYFTVENIKVEGLQRISEGTVFNYLPVNIGDMMTPQRIREAIRALYDTGFFRDVQLRRQGDTLLVVVHERPSIESFKISGNKAIKTKDLQKSLRGVGLSIGKTFNREVLDQVKQYLTDQYFSRGKYGVRIDTKVEPQSGNRVKVDITIHEGARATIREINVVGNKAFTDKQLRSGFELKTPNWLSWYKHDDRYSRESLQGDLEKLRSYYMDRGYANFEIASTQVTISPNKNNIYITVNVHEGKVYKIASVKLAGTFVVPKADLERLLLVRPGQIFSRKIITATQKLIQDRLGDDGYAFAKVEPVPSANDANSTVDLTFFIDPGNRVYVRKISFTGTKKINDNVLRRELRQLEGGWLSNVALERSKQRIQRLPYVKKVDDSTTPVPGSPDQVDVDFKIKDGPSASLSGGIGYSAAYKFSLSASYADANFLGTGQRVAVQLDAGAYQKQYSFSQTNPYLNIDGLSRTFSLSYSDITQFTSQSSDFSTKRLVAGLDFGYNLTEYQRVRFGVTLQHAKLITVEGSSALQAQQWVQQNGHPFSRVGITDVIDPLTGLIVPGTYNIYGTKFNVAEFLVGWSYDTRNRTLFADRGTLNALTLSATLPTSQVDYWVANYNFLHYIPLWHGLTLSFNAQLGYGAGYGKTTALPPFRQFYGGGPNSVRGWEEDTLGPKDNYGNPYGGNIEVVGRTELIFPMPAKWRASARVSLFFDIGNIFSSGNVKFYGRDDVTPVDYSFGFDKLKRSTGIAVEWLAPLGLFRFSFAVPLNVDKGDAIRYGDQVERFQFSIGQAF